MPTMVPSAPVVEKKGLKRPSSSSDMMTRASGFPPPLSVQDEKRETVPRHMTSARATARILLLILVYSSNK